MKNLFVFKILLLLSFYNCSYSQYLAFDTSFGNNGSMVFTDIYHSRCHKLLMDSNGKLIFSWATNKIVRLTPNGTLDTTFGTNGTLITPIIQENYYNVDIFLLNDNILYFYKVGSIYRLVLLNPDGTTNLSFGNNGEIVFDSSTNKKVYTDSSNNIYVLNMTSTSSQTLTRYLSNGDIDTSYGNNGFIQLNFNIPGNYDFIKIVKITSNELYIHKSNYPNYNLYKLNIDGSFDNTFGNNGVANIPALSSFEPATHYNFLPSGGFLSSIDRIISKFDSNGQIDLSFGVNGSREIQGISYATPKIYNDKIYFNMSFSATGGNNGYVGKIQTLNLNASNPPEDLSLVNESFKNTTHIQFIPQDSRCKLGRSTCVRV